MAKVPSDEDVGRQILGVFLRNKIRRPPRLAASFISDERSDVAIGKKRTIQPYSRLSAFDPKRTFGSRDPALNMVGGAANAFDWRNRISIADPLIRTITLR
ncbi:MAG: hypothetical protein WA214_24465, partial [Pseudolabrys sp.]